MEQGKYPAQHRTVHEADQEGVLGSQIYESPFSNTGSTQDWHEEFISKYPRKLGRPRPDRTSQRDTFSPQSTSESDVWARPVALTLDGGGVRGLSSLVILKALMEAIAGAEDRQWPSASTSGDSPELGAEVVAHEMRELKKQQTKLSNHGSRDDHSNFLPCHYFDYIGGTSTGGIIAIMLGRLWMSASLALQEFRQLSQGVYQLRNRSTSRSFSFFFLRHGRKEETKMRKEIEKHFDPGIELRSDYDRCKTIICSFEQRSSGDMTPFVFRSYDEGASLNDPVCFKVTDVMRATACSPYYFAPVKVGRRQFCDTGLSWTNPTGEVWRQMSHRNSAESFIISIGCGYDTDQVRTPSKTSKKHSVDTTGNMVKISIRVNEALATISEEVHRRMEEISRSSELEYYRFNAKFDLSSLDTGKIHSRKDEIDLLQDEIEQRTFDYLKSPLVKESIELLAKDLVALRRYRCKTAEWEAFAFGLRRYRCPLPHDCPMHNISMSRTELTSHITEALNQDEGLVEILQKEKKLSRSTDAIKMLVDQGRSNSDEMEQESKRLR